MRILYLTGDIENPYYSEIFKFLIRIEKGQVNHITEPIDIKDLLYLRPDWIISYGYRHIIKQDVIDFMEGNIANLHISYLPYNRGSDPNLWSWLVPSPQGVTIHQIDKGLDTGAIYSQYLVTMKPERETLESSYKKLHQALVILFKSRWEAIKERRIIAKKQKGKGSYHKLTDKESLMEDLPNGFKTPIIDVIETYKRRKNGLYNS